MSTSNYRVYLRHKYLSALESDSLTTIQHAADLLILGSRGASIDKHWMFNESSPFLASLVRNHQLGQTVQSVLKFCFEMADGVTEIWPSSEEYKT